MNMTKELSESLLAACKAAGIEKPGYIAQNANGKVIHHDNQPSRKGWDSIWGGGGIPKRLNHPPYADDWKESLMEWVEPQGEPLAEVLTQHPESFTIETERNDDGEVIAHFVRDHHGDITEMIRPDHVADTSKMIDDACEIAYHAHLEKGNGLCWSRLDCYRAAWQDALAWKGGSDD